MLNLLWYIIALGVVVAFISPISSFVDIAQQSDHMNCKGYVFDGDSSHSLSFNSTLDNDDSGSPIGCLAIKLYLPYILLIFLIGGIASVLAGKAFGFGQEKEEYY